MNLLLLFLGVLCINNLMGNLFSSQEKEDQLVRRLPIC
jgi:hypothetical protein